MHGINPSDATVSAAAQNMSPKELEQLIQGLRDDEALRKEAEEAIRQLRRLDRAQEINEAIQKETVDSPLSDNEMEDIRKRVADAMEKVVPLEQAVHCALPVKQNIWDTAQNTVRVRRDDDLKFAPFKSTTVGMQAAINTIAAAL